MGNSENVHFVFFVLSNSDCMFLKLESSVGKMLAGSLDSRDPEGLIRNRTKWFHFKVSLGPGGDR